MNSVMLPWPVKELSPNARVHWAVKARAAKAYRKECWVRTLAAGWSAHKYATVGVHLEFCAPNKRRHDMDNMLARMKSGLDGLADAMKVNDSQFRLSASWGAIRPHGAVVVAIL